MSGISSPTVDGGLLAHAGEVDAQLIAKTGELAIEHNPAEAYMQAFQSARQLANQGQQIKQQGDLIQSEIQKNKWDQQLAGKTFDHQVQQDKLEIGFKQQMQDLQNAQFNQSVKEHQDTYGVQLATLGQSMKAQEQNYSLAQSGQAIQQASLNAQIGAQKIQQDQGQQGLNLQASGQKIEQQKADLESNQFTLSMLQFQRTQKALQDSNTNTPEEYAAKTASENDLIKTAQTAAVGASKLNSLTDQYMSAIKNATLGTGLVGGTYGKIAEHSFGLLPGAQSYAQIDAIGNNILTQIKNNEMGSSRYNQTIMPILEKQIGSAFTPTDKAQTMGALLKSSATMETQFPQFLSGWKGENHNLDNALSAYSDWQDFWGKQVTGASDKGFNNGVPTPSQQDLSGFIKNYPKLQAGAQANNMDVPTYMQASGIYK